jgi:CheY-like chemotaxis protein
MCVIRTILVAEDDENDFVLISRALKAAGFVGTILRAGDGDEAIRKLERMGMPEAQLPALALIDLKMPRADGFDVLEWKRLHTELPCVPLIIFSSSNEECDVKKAYELGAHAFTTKPNGFERYIGYCASLQDWWCRCEFMEG